MHGSFTVFYLEPKKAPGLHMTSHVIWDEAYLAYAFSESKNMLVMDWVLQEPVLWRTDGVDYVRQRMASHVPHARCVYATGHSLSLHLSDKRSPTERIDE